MEEKKVVPAHEQNPWGLRKWTRATGYLFHEVVAEKAQVVSVKHSIYGHD
jgi:hypothetical protein